MAAPLMTSVTATVAPEDEDRLRAGFARLAYSPLPDGLLRTELLRAFDGSWTVQTLWRDREALEAVRTSADPPAAMELFRSLGADHTHNVLTVEYAYP